MGEASVGEGADTPGILWRPDAARLRRAHLTRFLERAGLPDYASLHRWSVEEPAAFWGELAVFCDIRWRRPPDTVLEHGDRMPGARWFPGATLNYAENLLRFRDDHPALVWRDERRARGELSYRQLHAQVKRAAAGLRRLGVGPGDRVAAVLPNGPEAVIAMLATTSLGAIWSSCSPDFGAVGILDRFGQIAPKVLVVTTGYDYGGKHIDTTASLARLAASLADGLAGLAAVVWTGPLEKVPDTFREKVTETVTWAELSTGTEPLEFAALPFDHPACILYSSGTTGPPKAIVHGAGGILLQHLKEHLLHTDLHRSDRLFYYTTCGWMMWNWLVGGLASGATLVLYDGSATHPDPAALWRLAEEEGITVFGTSARWLAGQAKSGVRPRDAARLTALRTLLSTGSPLLPAQFDWVYAAVKADLHLASISGGTDLCACFALGNPLLPVHRGELQCAGLGMAVDIYDEQGRPQDIGRGELVCTRPFPSQPVGFFGDTDGERYRRAYYDRYPGVWAHGDHAGRTAGGGFVIHGRSDAVLNPGGVRIGTAEIYRAVATVPEVLECLAVAQRWEGDERIVLFVVPANGHVLDDALRDRIRGAIRAVLSPRHVPAKILAVPDLPRTRNGKLSELVVRAVIHGEPAGNEAALANPEVLRHFRDMPELQVP